MKVAVVGGSGFMGYDFVRALLAQGGGAPVVYCTHPAHLPNLARHEIDIRSVPYERLAHELVDADTGCLVNFAHPFSSRDGLSPAEQITILGEFFCRNLRQRPSLKLIHLSSMSVYEPFAGGREFCESSAGKPPRADHYACNKQRIEHLLLKPTASAPRTLILRPTVVYGPFCRPWTDNLLAAFAAGDVPYVDLGGRIQPLYVQDVSRFVLARLSDFRPGILNMAGPQAMPWHDFLGFFAAIAGRGALVPRAAGAGPAGRPGFGHNVRAVLSLLDKEPAFVSLLRPLVMRIPGRLRRRLRARFLPAAADYRRPEGAQGNDALLGSPFFAQDRLVSTALLRRLFPDFLFTPLPATCETMQAYFRFRFTDAVYRSGEPSAPEQLAETRA